MSLAERLTIGEVAKRSGAATSALRHYEALGLLSSTRDGADRRCYPRAALRRIAIIRAAQTVGLSLADVRSALGTLPEDPTAADWTVMATGWRQRLDEQIDALVALRDGLTSCIGCGCLSLDTCHLVNADDAGAEQGPGAVRLPARLRRQT